MKPLWLVVLVLAASPVHGDLDVRNSRSIVDSQNRFSLDTHLVYGTGVIVRWYTPLQKAYELITDRREFRKNWPLYGYAMPIDKNADPCGMLDASYSQFSIGKAAVVLQKAYNSSTDSVAYLGFPMESVSVLDSGSSPALDHATTDKRGVKQTGFTVGDFCAWLESSEKIGEIMRKVDAIPFDFPDGRWEKVEIIADPDLEPVMTGVVERSPDSVEELRLVWRSDAGETIAWTPTWDESPVRETRILWKYSKARPNDESGFKGDYFLSWLSPDGQYECVDEPQGTPSSDRGCVDITWSSANGEMTWKQVPGGKNLSGSRFTMWFKPNSHHVRSTRDDLDLYVLAQEPMPHLPANIRVEAPSLQRW